MSLTVQQIKVRKSQTKTTKTPIVVVEGRYHPAFNTGAKKLNGQFIAKTYDKPAYWYFDARDEEAVRELCRKVYGTDGADNAELVDIEVQVEQSANDDIFLYGRCIARAAERNGSVKLGDGVILKNGQFRTRKAQEYVATIEIRDVPISMVDDHCTIVRRTKEDLTPLARPFENATDEELTALLVAIQKELALRHPTPDYVEKDDSAQH